VTRKCTEYTGAGSRQTTTSAMMDPLDITGFYAKETILTYRSEQNCSGGGIATTVGVRVTDGYRYLLHFPAESVKFGTVTSKALT
jgi:hypothetical protein